MIGQNVPRSMWRNVKLKKRDTINLIDLTKSFKAAISSVNTETQAKPDT